MRLINLDDILKQFPKADFDGDAIENMKAYPHWKTDITGLFTILKSVPIIEACEDAISREEVKKTIDKLRSTVGNDIMDGMITENNINWLKFEIEQLPSVTPKAKKGEWIDTHFTTEWWGGTYQCSLCGEELIGRGNYCPACGAEMR